MQERRFIGCMLGLAIGDALGAPVEFLQRSAILRELGAEGVQDLLPWSTGRRSFPRGSYTDDTQMALATALGLLDAVRATDNSGIEDAASAVHARYLEWLDRQKDPFYERSPGNTCLSALRSGVAGTMDDPLNESPGCGGIMRIAPVGLLERPERAFEVGAEMAALTHGAAAGFLSAGFFADVISRVARGRALMAAIAETREVLLGYEDFDETLEKVDEAVELYISDVHPVEAIRQLGEGWTGHEALGIALLCALSYPDDWDLAVLAAVNITGDSDSTGSLTGALAGTALGVEAIPTAWVRDVEDSAMIRAVAEELFAVAVA